MKNQGRNLSKLNLIATQDEIDAKAQAEKDMRAAMKAKGLDENLTSELIGSYKKVDGMWYVETIAEQAGQTIRVNSSNGMQIEKLKAQISRDGRFAIYRI